MKTPELLAPAGTFSKLKTALHFGADAVYVAGKQFGLRSYAGNFDEEELRLAAEYTHTREKKLYVTVNVFARNADFAPLLGYLKFLESIRIDAVIVSDPGIVGLIRENRLNLAVHLSTQANTTNLSAVRFWGGQGVSRVVLARELSLSEVAEISRGALPVETEIFVHGAMCISYSGRCLLSNYLNGRDSNRGECVQACRWNYRLTETDDEGKSVDVAEDERGTYFLNSKDLCLLPHLKDVTESGVASLKIEGRMKSEYYVGCTVNAYRRALNLVLQGQEPAAELMNELYKTGHRSYTCAYALGENADTERRDTARTAEDYRFIAEVMGYDEGRGLLEVEMRNRFFEGDSLEVLSPGAALNRQLKIGRMFDLCGERVRDAKLVQQRLLIETDLALEKHDILRMKNTK